MNNVQQKINSCCLCNTNEKLTENSVQIGTTPFIIIGESPAKDGWITSKKAFYNTAGKLQGSGRVMEKLLNNIGLSISDIYFTECCKCIIEDRKNLELCSANCLPFLIEQLNLLPCKIIITMGLHPTQALLGIKIKKFADYVGQEFEIKLGTKTYTLIPIYHPSPLNPKGYKDNLPIFDKIQTISKSLTTSKGESMYKGDHKKGEIEIIEENKVFENRFCEFFDDKVKFPSGATGSFLRLAMRGKYSVAVLPVTKEGKMIFIKTFRHSARGWGYEVPKGYGSETEPPETCAQRELMEETGLKSNKLVYLGLYHESPSTLQYGLHCFIALNCEKVSNTALEESEAISGSIAISSLDELPEHDYKDAISEMIVAKYNLTK